MTLNFDEKKAREIALQKDPAILMGRCSEGSFAVEPCGCDWAFRGRLLVGNSRFVN